MRLLRPNRNPKLSRRNPARPVRPPRTLAKDTSQFNDTEYAYLATLWQKDWYGDTNDQHAVDVGHDICRWYAKGYDMFDVWGEMKGTGFTAEQSGYTQGVAIAAFCPEHEDKLTP
jgi:hypothetical protein